MPLFAITLYKIHLLQPLSRENENGPGIGYHISYRSSGQGSYIDGRTLGNVSTTFITSLLPNRQYDIRLQAYNNDGYSPTVTIFKACTCVTGTLLMSRRDLSIYEEQLSYHYISICDDKV